jgi:Autophagy protein Apg5
MSRIESNRMNRIESNRIIRMNQNPSNDEVRQKSIHTLFATMASPKDPSADLVRSCNWSGSIPVVLTLAPTSLGTTMMPHPIHLMVPRGSFLHVALRTAIQRFHKFAPATISFTSGRMIIRNEPAPKGDDDEGDEEGKNYSKTPSTSTTQQTTKMSTQKPPWKFPVCWLEDEETQIPLRWHIFAGVLFDMMTTTRQSAAAPTTPIPWKIRLHFMHYPTSQILPLEADEVWTTIERSFKNSLKQALFMQYGNSRIAMNMSRVTHQRCWDAIEAANYKLYQQINEDLQATTQKSQVQQIPIRVFLDSKPPIQRPCPGTGKLTMTLLSLVGTLVAVATKQLFKFEILFARSLARPKRLLLSNRHSL